MQIAKGYGIIYAMELPEANKILRSVKTAMAVDGFRVPQAAETDGLLMLLGKLDGEKYLAPKIKRAQGLDALPQRRKAERVIAFFRALNLFKDGIRAPVSLFTLTIINKTLFGDLEEQAGKLRDRAAELDGNAFTDPKYIQGSLRAITQKMNAIDSAPIIGKDDFAGYISHYTRELVILHPFDIESEFTVRLFIMLFCKLKGFGLSLYRTTPDSLRAATNTAFLTDDVTPLYNVLLTCLTYEQTTVTTPQRAQKTRREINGKPQKSVTVSTPPPEEIVTVKQKALENRAAKKDNSATDDILKRAIRLQQKISKLNEQLTRLIQPLDDTANSVKKQPKDAQIAARQKPLQKSPNGNNAPIEPKQKEVGNNQTQTEKPDFDVVTLKPEPDIKNTSER